MPSRVRLELLGGFQASYIDGSPCRLPTRKAEAVLTFLALHAGRYESRDRLAALLWDGVPEGQARQSLRQALATIRRSLGEGPEPLVLTGGDGVALNETLVTVDVIDFEAAVASGGMEALERAAALYRGDFLAGFRLDEAPFEEWRRVERERLHELALEALTRLLNEQLRVERVESSIRTALRILSLDPLQEVVHRTVMRLLLQQGRRAAALQQYQACVGHLQHELGAEPEEETRQLYREILRAVRPGGDRASLPGLGAATRVVDAPMIGRDGKLERLRRAVARMLDHGGHVVLLSGEAGVGKTRLIEEFTSSEAVHGLRLSLGRCHETEQTLPFRPWVEALRGDGAVLDESLGRRLGAGTRAQLAALFPELAPGGAVPAAGAQPALLFEPILELVGVLTSEQPLVLVIEDLHWADSMSARLFAFLGRRIRRWPVLVVGSTRPEELVDAPTLAQALKELRGDHALEEVTLEPLSEADSRALARALRPLPRAHREWDRLESEIWSVSEGNPFVIVESLRSVQQGHEAWRVGRRIQDFVSARLARLTELPRHCVAVAAAIGRDFSFALLARAARLDERQTADAVEELVRRRMFDSVGDRLDFCHDWIRQVAYEGLIPARRAVLHAAIGAALEELHRDRLDDVADQLGSHYSRAGDFRKAVLYLMQFGQLAGYRYALDDAARALAQAMAVVERVPTPERDGLRLEVALRHAFVLSVQGRHREILDLLGAHQETVERVGDLKSASEYYFRCGLSLFFLGEWTEGGPVAQRALEYGERVGDAESIGKALHVLSLRAWALGRPRDGISHATRQIALLGRPHMETWLGLAYHDLALNHLVAGELDAALAAVKRVEEIGRAAPRLLPFSAYVGAWVHALRGATELAIETAQAGLGLSRDTTTRVLLSGTLGYAYLEHGDAAAAVSTLTEVVDQLGSTPVRSAQIRHTALLGEAHLLAGDRQRAHDLATRAVEAAQGDGMPYHIGIAQRALARVHHAVGELPAAEQWLSEALATFVRCDATFEAARTRVDLAMVQAARGDMGSAREQIGSALAAFDTANAPRRAAAALDRMRSLLDPSPPPDARIGAEEIRSKT